MTSNGNASILGFLLVACLVAFSVNAAQTEGDSARGKKLYARLCSGCHSIDANRMGPLHKGVFGRKAGTAPGYQYSPALKASNIVWDQSTLEKWLANPQGLIPGQKMNVDVDSQKDRTDIIAYLKSVS